MRSSKATTVSAPTTIADSRFSEGSFSKISIAFMQESSMTISQGIWLFVLSSILLGMTSNVIPICSSSSRRLGEAEASMILFMVHLRDKYSVVHLMLLHPYRFHCHMAKFQL